jgi:pilus assembly protein CpaB
MKPARLLVLAVALAAAGGAALLVTRRPAPPNAVVVETTVPVRTVEILVASSDLPRGQILKAQDLRWQQWPVDYRPAGSLARNEAPGASQDNVGAIVLSTIAAGEPIRPEKLVKPERGGFMSAILPTGMRAMAISIDSRGSNSVGGFILPNDRVDVIRTYRDEESSKAGGTDVQISETVLSNIRVLAIGSNVQERAPDKTATGETATLELTASQVEQLTLAQKVGHLSLALRSLADAGQPGRREEATDAGLTIVRYGVAQPVAKR